MVYHLYIVVYIIIIMLVKPKLPYSRYEQNNHEL